MVTQEQYDKAQAFYWQCVRMGEGLHKLSPPERYTTTGFMIEALSNKTTPEIFSGMSPEFMALWNKSQQFINTFDDIKVVARLIYTQTRLLIRPDAYGGVDMLHIGFGTPDLERITKHIVHMVGWDK